MIRVTFDHTFDLLIMEDCMSSEQSKPVTNSKLIYDNFFLRGRCLFFQFV